MRQIITSLALFSLFLSASALAVKDGNCWDPSTWGHDCSSEALVAVDQIPVEFLESTTFVSRLTQMSKSGTHVEGQSLTVQKIEREDRTIFIFTTTLIFMPPRGVSVLHFVLSKMKDSLPGEFEISEVKEGKFCSQEEGI